MTKAGLRTKIGENIRNERQARNMSIDELAELLELTPGFVGLIERGQRGATAYTLFRLSAIFSVPVDAIFTQRLNRPDEEVLEDIRASGAKSRRIKITSLINGLSESELDFVIQMLKGMKILSVGLLREQCD